MARSLETFTHTTGHFRKAAGGAEFHVELSGIALRRRCGYTRGRHSCRRIGAATLRTLPVRSGGWSSRRTGGLLANLLDLVGRHGRRLVVPCLTDICHDRGDLLVRVNPTEGGHATTPIQDGGDHVGRVIGRQERILVERWIDSWYSLAAWLMAGDAHAGEDLLAIRHQFACPAGLALGEAFCALLTSGAPATIVRQAAPIKIAPRLCSLL